MSDFAARLIARGAGQSLADAPLIRPVVPATIFSPAEPDLVEIAEDVIVPPWSGLAPRPAKASVDNAKSSGPAAAAPPSKALQSPPAPRPPPLAGALDKVVKVPRSPARDPAAVQKERNWSVENGHDPSPLDSRGHRHDAPAHTTESPPEPATSRRAASLEPAAPQTNELVRNIPSFERQVMHRPTAMAVPGPAADRRDETAPLVTIGRIDIEVIQPAPAEPRARTSGFDSYARIRSGLDR